MEIVAIAGMAPITRDPSASKALYRDTLGLPLKANEDYLSVDNFEGAKHFGVWPLRMAAQSCFGFELADIAAVHAAVAEMKEKGQRFIHEARLEPWGQTVARFMSRRAC